MQPDSENLSLTYCFSENNAVLNIFWESSQWMFVSSKKMVPCKVFVELNMSPYLATITSENNSFSFCLPFQSRKSFSSLTWKQAIEILEDGIAIFPLGMQK